MSNSTPAELIAVMNLKKTDNLSKISFNDDQISTRDFIINESTGIIEKLTADNVVISGENAKIDEVIAILEAQLNIDANN